MAATATKPEIAFIGLGAMGFGMATHLVRRGYPVTGFDVWPPTLERFRAAGGRTATSPADAASRAPHHCVCMVATAQQAQSVLLDGESPAVPALARGATLLLCSTVPCAYVQGLRDALAARGRADIQLVDCPVSGGSARAADGTLSIMAGADDDEAPAPAAVGGAARFLLEELADPEKLYVVRGGAGAGSNMKMCHQVLAAVQILAASEGMGLADRLGLDPAYARDGILGAGEGGSKKGEAWAWMFEHRVPRMLAPGFQPVASALTIILKDAGIVTSEARRVGFPAPMTGAAEQVYLSALGRGYGADDDSSMIRLYAEGKGNVGPVQEGAAATDEAKLALVLALLKGIYLCSAAEAVAFARRCGLDLDQVYELCVNAAGGSTVFTTVAPEMVKLLRDEPLSAASDGESLGELELQLQEAVAEAQRLKMPLYLGSQALSLIRLAMQHAPSNVERLHKASVVRVWAP